MQEWCTMKMVEFQGSSEERARGYWGAREETAYSIVAAMERSDMAEEKTTI